LSSCESSATTNVCCAKAKRIRMTKAKKKETIKQTSKQTDKKQKRKRKSQIRLSLY
jgi:hypothetical protein